MITKTIRSRFPHEVGDTVEGGRVLEVRVIIPPEPAENRRGVYEYLVEALPVVEKVKSKPARKAEPAAAPEAGSFTRATPDEMGNVIRRLPSR